MTVAALSLIGIPLTGGFVTKYYLVLGSFESDRWILVPIMLVSSLLTAVYMGKCLQRVWFPAPDAPVTVGRDGPWVMRIPTLVLAAACLVFGIAAFLPVGLAAEAVAALFGGR
jgi:multicomponent Na+:H+ antiporter subunit D